MRNVGAFRSRPTNVCEQAKKSQIPTESSSPDHFYDELQ